MIISHRKSLDPKKFISELQGHAAFAGCTVLFITSSRQDDASLEHTMVDGAIELGEELYGTRPVRRIQLRLTRGSAALTGLHECEITGKRLVVYPRLESLYSPPTSSDSADITRIPSGIGSLDDILSGGLHSSNVTLVMGPSGIGETALISNSLVSLWQELRAFILASMKAQSGYALTASR